MSEAAAAAVWRGMVGTGAGPQEAAGRTHGTVALDALIPTREVAA